MMDPFFDTLYLQIPWISDLKSFISPFLLVVICKQVRMCFFTVCQGEKPINSIVDPTLMTPSQGNLQEVSRI